MDHELFRSIIGASVAGCRSARAVKDWISDSIDSDDPALIKQLKNNAAQTRIR